MAGSGERAHALIDVDFAGLEPPVVVGCSGGADSTALLALAAGAGLRPTAVHVDHCARPGSAGDAEVVASLAAALGTGFHAEQAPTRPGPGFEARAREGRYRALERARAALGATAVLVGHSRDDQAETVLLNLLRGGATAGLAGIPPRRDGIARPLLGVSRADLAGLCLRLGLHPLSDPMNADTAHRRVWLRREVLPALEAGTGRDLRALLARQAALARAESDLLDGLAAEALAELGEPPEVEALAGLPDALARRAIRLWLGPPPPPAGHVEAVLEVASGRRRAVDLPGRVRVVRGGGRLRRVAGGSPAADAMPGPVPVDLPGSVCGLGVRLEAWVEHSPPLRWPEGRWTAVLDAERAGPHAVLRPARPGERYVPLGLNGHKNLSEALAEAGVPPEQRASHPVLATQGGPEEKDLWVLGYRIADYARVSASTRRFLWVTAEGDSRG